MPIDSTSSPRVPLTDVNANVPSEAQSASLKTHNPDDVAALLAKRRGLRAELEKLAGADGVDGNRAAAAAAATATGTSGSKFNANPYAPSAEALRRVATQAGAGPVLPPPAANIQAITPAQAAAMAKRMQLLRAHEADGTRAAPPSAQAIVDAFTLPSRLNAKLTAQEAASFKQFVGVAPPAALVVGSGEAQAHAEAPSPRAASAASSPRTAAATQAQAQTAAPGAGSEPAGDNVFGAGSAFSFASSSDSAAALKIRSETFVPWGRFAVQRVAKEQVAMAHWALMHHKIVQLAAAVSVLMLQVDVTAEQNQIAFETASKILALARSTNLLNNAPLRGPLKTLIGNEQVQNVNIMDTDLATGHSQNPRGALHDLQRMELLRKVAAEGDPNSKFDRYKADDLAPVTREPNAVMLRMPGDHPGAPSALIDRTLLSDQEIRALSPAAATQYQRAMQDMEAQSKTNLPLMTALYDNEARMCRLAAARCEQPHAAQMAGQAQGFRERAENLQAKGDDYRRQMNKQAMLCLQDENIYGDLLRNRFHHRNGWEPARQAIAAKLKADDNNPPLTPAQRAHLEREKLNLDWRCIEVDNLLANFSNTGADSTRGKRWFTGSPQMVDGFLDAHLAIQPAKPPSTEKEAAQVTLERMKKLAPKGAAQINDLHIKAIQNAPNLGWGPQLFKKEDLDGISRSQMQRHLADREKALAAIPERTSPATTDHDRFIESEKRQIKQAIAYWRDVAPITGKAVGKPNPVAHVFGLSAMDRSMRQVSRQPGNTKPLPNLLTDNGLGDARTEHMDDAAYRAFMDKRASAGTATLGGSYDNPVFESLNVLADAANILSANVAPVQNAMGGIGDGFAQDVSGHAANELSEAYGNISQDENAVLPMMEQLLGLIYKVS